MELDFDKEIDAILRKARGDTGAVMSTGNGSHLDADVIAAFAENALPQTTKLLYTQHLADCDRCRKQLSQSIAMNTGADAAAAPSVSAVLTEPVIPWYQKLFATRNLAFGMGALVLVFSGVLGYLVLQRGQGGNATVSQVTRQEPTKGGPSVGGESEAANANANLAAAPAANMAANMAARSADSTIAVTPPGTGIGFGEGQLASPADRKELPSNPVTSTETGAGVRAAEEPSIVSAAPPPPPAGITIDGASGADAGKKDQDERERKAEDDLELAKKSKVLEDRSASRRDMPPPAAKTGPSRSGPVQMQSNQVNSGNFDMSVTRRVGGKTFSNRDRVWYDSAYHGQATINHKRGTVDYNKLDGGLRSIANTLGGTVVVVWKSKAYRIQ